MVDIFSLKVGDKIRYDIPDDFIKKNEKFKYLNGTISEVIEIAHVFHPDSFDAVIKPVVKDINNGQERAISPILYGYIKLIEE